MRELKNHSDDQKDDYGDTVNSQYMPMFSLFDIHRCRMCITLCRLLKAVLNSLKSFCPKKLMARLYCFSKKTISCLIWISNLDPPSKLWQKWRKCHNDFERQFKLSVATQLSNLPLRNLDININTKHWLLFTKECIKEIASKWSKLTQMHYSLYNEKLLQMPALDISQRGIYTQLISDFLFSI